MSWKLQALVADRVCGSITRKMVLLNMASRANDDGTGVYASLPMIAGWCEVDARTVRRVVRDLEAESIITQCGWKDVKNGKINSWTVNVEVVEALPLYKDEVAVKRAAKAAKMATPDTVSAPKNKRKKSVLYASDPGHSVRADTKSGRTQDPATPDTGPASSILEPNTPSEAKASSGVVALDDFRLTSGEAPTTAKKGSRLAVDWRPSEKDVRYAVMHGIKGRWLENTIANFVGYWSNLPGAKALKLNWSQAWEGEVRKEALAQRHKPGMTEKRAHHSPTRTRSKYPMVYQG